MVTHSGNPTLGNNVFSLQPAEFIKAISGMAVGHQIDMAMAYCRQPIYWQEFITDPVSGAWIKANAKALNERANRRT